MQRGLISRLPHSSPLLSSPLLSSLLFSSLLLFTSCSEITETKVIERRAVVREKTVSADMYHQQIGYCNKNETCVLYPKMPKAWLANGFIIVPSLSEKGERQIAQKSPYPSVFILPSVSLSLFGRLYIL